MNLTITIKKVKYCKAYLTIFITGLMLAAAQQAQGQQIGFVQQDVIKIPGITTSSQLTGLTAFEKQTTRSYYGGLGQGIQTVMVKGSPSQKDLIQPIAYDALGRQTTSYLPYAGTVSTGDYHPNALTTEQAAFYNNGVTGNVADDSIPSSSQLIEGSPLQRLLNAGTVGSGFQPGQHAKVFNYRSNNTAADGSIIMWGPTGLNTGNYDPADLSVTEATDEDNIKIATFTDLAGHTVLKRQYTRTAGVYVDTYYIYNNAGMVSYVIPPKALAIMVANSSYSLTQTGVNKLIFQFGYDSLGRLTQKTVPGTGTVNMIYDPLNRLVLTQDAKMAGSYKWYYIKYDAKGHAISQGIYVDASHLSAGDLQTAVTNNTTYNTYWYETRNIVSTTGYYTNNTFPSAAITPLAYSYYNNYDLDQNGTDDYSKTSQGLTGEAGQTTDSLRGVLTMVRKTTLGSGITAGTWLTSIYFYDSQGHAIQVKSNNQITTAISDVKTNAFDFTGAPVQTKIVKVAGSTTTTVLSTMTYDHMHRITAIDQSYNAGTPIRIAVYNYNELGQLIDKGLGQMASGTIPANVTLSGNYPGTQTIVATNSIIFSSSPATTIPSGATFKAFISSGYLQSVDYRYNIRGQLLSINNSKLSNDGGTTNNDSNDLFGMQFLYDQVDANLGVKDTARYNGRLAAVKWMSTDANGTSSYERSYSYGYDAIARLTSANYAERTTASTGTFSNNIGGFDESGIKYDVNGNILALNRNSSTQGTNTNVQVDLLGYTYDTTNPNQLLKVSDGTGANYTGYGFRNLTGATSTATYTYDVNGNLSADPYKGLTLTYNDLNRTDKITVTTATNRYINYTYDAGGVLLRKQSYDNNVLQTTTDYSDGFVYVNNALSYFAMPEGRVRNTGTALKPEYIISDQQGNARISFEESATSPGTAVVRQENSYYAFGLVMPNSPVGTPAITDNKQLYNGGSEWQNDFSNLPDYYQTFYRNYDAALGRFVAVDPMAEVTESLSSYHYADNNPITYNDPMGNNVYHYNIDPFSPGFNSQVGDIWSDPGNPAAGGGAGANGDARAANAGTNGDSGDGSGGGSGGGSNARFYAMYNAAYNAAVSGNPLDVEQYAATYGRTVDIFVNNDGEVSLGTGGKNSYINIQGSDNSWVSTKLAGANQGGKGATAYVELDGLGHTYIEVNGTIFSFGRYAGGNSPALGRFDPNGPGILIKATHQFAVDRMKKFPTNVYQFPNADANTIYNYLNGIYNQGTPNTNKNGGVYTGMTYTLLGPNCTTIVVGALQMGGVNIPDMVSPNDFVRWENGNLYPAGMHVH
jgi:RHS repeat-associated protein